MKKLKILQTQTFRSDAKWNFNKCFNLNIFETIISKLPNETIAKHYLGVKKIHLIKRFINDYL